MSTDLVPAQHTFCFIHGVSEPDMPGDFRSCWECGHIYRSVWDLLLAELEFWRTGVMAGWVHPLEVPPFGDAERISSCPLCAHDF